MVSVIKCPQNQAIDLIKLVKHFAHHLIIITCPFWYPLKKLLLPNKQIHGRNIHPSDSSLFDYLPEELTWENAGTCLYAMFVD